MSTSIDNERNRNEHLLRMATYASVAVALALITIKWLASASTGSVGILASLVDSVLDALASVINLFAVRYALMPADREHRFGHGKAEPLAGLAQVGFIAMSAVFLIVRAIERLLEPRALEETGSGIAVMLLATGLTLLLVVFQRYVVRRTKSLAISADALHYATDLLGNAVVIAGLVAAIYGILWVDGLVALLVAGFVIYSASRIAWDSLQQLMDHEIDDADKARVLEVANRNPDVLGVHDLRTRQSGQRTFVQMHLDLDEDLPLRDAHDIADQVETDVARLFTDAEVIVHQDPVQTRANRQSGQSTPDSA